MIVDKLVHLQEFYAKVKNFEELPRSFDDTLIDKLIDHMTLEDGMLTLISEQISRTDVDEQSTVPLIITVRLAHKALQNKSHLCSPTLAQFLTRSIALLHQDRPLILLSALLKLYTTAYDVVGEGNWKEELVSWILCVLPHENLSVFVRRDAENFCYLLSGSVVEKIIPMIMELFHKTDSFLVRDSMARLLKFFHLHIAPTAGPFLLKSIQQMKYAGHPMCELAASLISESHIFDSLSVENWASESIRLSVAVICIEKHKTCVDPLKSSLLYSPALTLSHFSIIGEFITKEEFLSLLSNWPTTNRRRSPNSEIEKVFSLGLRLGCSLDDLQNFTAKAFEQALHDPSFVLFAVSLSSIQEVLAQPKLSTSLHSLIMEGIQSDMWEHVDSALEIVLRFPNELRSSLPDCVLPSLYDLATTNKSPYVRSLALKAMNHFQVEGVEILAFDKATKDADPQPRLEALNILHSRLPLLSGDAGFSLIDQVLEDCDLDVRRKMVSICADLLPNYPTDALRLLLDMLADDAEIGLQIRQTLGLPASDSLDTTDRVICEMLSSIGIRENEDDTIDCY